MAGNVTWTISETRQKLLFTDLAASVLGRSTHWIEPGQNKSIYFVPVSLFFTTLVDLVLICKRKQQQRCGECKDLQSFYSRGIFSLVCETSLMLPHADVRPPLLFEEGGVPPKGSYYCFIVLFHALYNLMDSHAESFSRCFGTVNSLHWGGEQEADGARHYI